MSFNRKSRVIALASATSVLAISAPAFAQDSDVDEVSGNSVIVVTAQKKSQNLQDVPISITAFDTEALESNRIAGAEDLGKVTPGVYVTPNPADNNGVRVNIRGVGTFDPQIGQDSRVALYVDGVYLGKTQGLAFDSPDLERVEILKGPQGTLYGRNSVAGAINMISARPNADGWSGKLSAEYGRFNHFKLGGAVNVPIGDVGGLRVSGLVSDRDGWVKNDGPGADFGGGSKVAFRVAFGADLTPDLRFDVAADYNKVKSEPLFYQSIPGFANQGAPFAAAIATSPGRQDRVTTDFTNEKGRLVTKGVSANLEWDFADNHKVKFTAAYREADSRRFVALVPTANRQILDAIAGGFNQAIAPTATTFRLAGQPLRPDFVQAFGPRGPNTGLFLSPPGGASSLDGHEQFSFEATFNGEFADGALEYTLGAYYYDEETGTDVFSAGNRDDVNSLLFLLGGFNPQIGAPIVAGAQILGNPTVQQLFSPLLPPAQRQAIIAQFLTPIVGDVNAAQQNPASLVSIYGTARQSAANDLRIDSKAFALYGEVTWHASDQLRVTGGLRFSDEKKDGVGQAKSPFFLDTTDLLGNIIPPNIGGFSFSKLNPSVVVEFDIHEDVMYYASFKQSFRSGGFNSAAVGTRLAGQTFGPDFLFGREDINAFEFGMKSDIFDNRLRINAAGFYYDISDLQTTVALNPLIATSRAVVNADEKIWGAEVDVLFAVTDDLSLFGSYSYINGNAGDVTNPLTMVREVRTELQGTPKNSFRVGFDYNTAVSDSMELFASANFSHKDDVLSIPQNALRLTNQNIVSGRIGVNWETSGGQEFTVSLWGENIFDDKYTIDSLPFETFAFRTQVFGQPASYGVTAGIKF